MVASMVTHVTTQAQDLHNQHLHLHDRDPESCCNNRFCITKEFLHKLSETVSGKLICMLVVFIGFSTWLQFVVVTNLSWQILTFVGIWHFGEVFLFKMKFLKFLRACSRQCRNNLHTDSTYTYRLYRRQCAKYTYIYSAHTVYYKDILSTNTHYTPYVHVYIMYTSIHSNMWRCNRL